MSKRDFKGLEYFTELVGKKLQMGIVLYCGKSIIKYRDNLYAMPVDIVWMHQRLK